MFLEYLHKSSIMYYSLYPVLPPGNGQTVIIHAHIFSFPSRVKRLSASKSKFLLFCVSGLSLSSSTQRFPQNILKLGAKECFTVITHNMQYKVVGIHFWSIKIMTLADGKILSNIPFPFKQHKQLQFVDENKSLQKNFKYFYHNMYFFKLHSISVNILSTIILLNICSKRSQI